MLAVNNFFTTGIGETEGLFGLQHLLYILISWGLVTILLCLTRKKDDQTINKYIKIISIIVTVLEILKIIWNLTLREEVTYEDYVPLYLCSFFIYASLLYAFTKNKDGLLHKIAKYFLFYGCLSGGVTFLFFPSTALMEFPFLHVLSIHSMVYHVLMVTVGLWMLRFIKPNLKDFKFYGIILLSIEIPLIILNFILESNFMMLNYVYGVAILEFFYNLLTPVVYPFFVAFGQLLMTFFCPLFFYLVLFKKVPYIKCK